MALRSSLKPQKHENNVNPVIDSKTATAQKHENNVNPVINSKTAIAQNSAPKTPKPNEAK